jgi:hypothetical protein
MAAEPLGTPTVRRLEWLTLLVGGLGVAWAGWRWGSRGAVGLALGVALSWINLRWLKGSVTAFGTAAAAQAESPSQPVPVPRSAYFKFVGRFALLLGAIYVILTRSWFPAASVLAGLFASAAGVLVGLVAELLAAGARDSFRRGS